MGERRRNSIHQMTEQEPQLPPGFKLDSKEGASLPPGFTLDPPAPKKKVETAPPTEKPVGSSTSTRSKDGGSQDQGTNGYQWAGGAATTPEVKSETIFTEKDFAPTKNGKPLPKQFTEAVDDIYTTAGKRGWNQGELANILNVNGGVVDDNVINEIARLQKENRDLRPSESYEKFNNAKTVGETLFALVEDPGAIIGELVMESTSALYRHGLYRVGAGMAAGAAAGSVVPGVGTAVGAGSGAIAGLGLASLNLELSGKIMDSFAENGVDTSDPEQLKKAFSDEKTYSAIRKSAYEKAVPIAVFDMMSAGVAGKILTKPAKTIIGKIGQGAAEMGVQMAMGGGGELAGELNSGEDISIPAIAGEMIGEIGGGGLEVATGTIARTINKGLPTLTEVSKAVGSIPSEVDKVKAMGDQIDVLTSTGEISHEQASDLIQETTLAIQNDAKIPAQIQGVQRSEALPVLVEKSQLENDIANLEAQKEATDPAFHSVIDEQIKVIQEQVNEKTSQIQEIINPKAEEVKAVEENPVVEETPAVTEEITPEILQENAKPALSILDAERSLQAGDRVFVTPEQDGQPMEITDVTGLKGYTEDQILILPKTQTNEQEVNQKGREEGLLAAPAEDPGTTKSEPVSSKEVEPEITHEKVYVTKEGSHTVMKTEDGKFIVRNKKNKPVSAYTHRKVMKEFVSNYNFDKGNRADFSGAKEMSQKDEARFIADNSKNPQEILEALSRVNKKVDENELDFKERLIADNIGKISHESFNDNSDRNLLKKEGQNFQESDNLKLSYLRKGGESIDMVAQRAEYQGYGESNGDQITPQDVVDFILKYPGGVKEFWNQASPDYQVLADAFRDLTGFDPNQEMIDKAKSLQVEDQFMGKPGFPEQLDEEPKQNKRKFTQQALKGTELSGESKAKIPDEAINYLVQSNTLSALQADQIIEDVGEDTAIELFMDLNNKINGGVRSVMGQQLIQRLENAGKADKAIKLLEDVTKKATDFGQFNQAFALWSRLSPQGQIRYMEKEVDKQRNTRSEREKSKIDKARTEIEKAVKKSINEALVNAGVEQAATNIPGKPPVRPNRKHTLVTKEKFDNAMKAVRKAGLFSVPFSEDAITVVTYIVEDGYIKFADFSERVVKEFGSKARPYLKELYKAAKEKLLEAKIIEEKEFDTDEKVTEIFNEARNKKIEAAFERAVKLKSEKDFAIALKMLNEAPNRDELWKKYKSYAVARLKNLPIQGLLEEAKQKPVLQEFVDGLVTNLRNKLLENATPAEKAKIEKRPAIQILGDAIKNFEKQSEVFEVAKAELEAKYADNPEKLAILDDTFGAITDSPFSKKLVNEAIRTELKSLDKTISDIAKAHYTEYDRIKMSLTDKLIDQADLSPEEAAKLAKSIKEEFDKIFAEKRKQVLDKLTKDKVVSKKVKDALRQEVTELINLGAFDDKAFADRWAKVNGYPELTKENIAELKRLADLVQKAHEGFQKFRALEDLLKYQAQIKGMNWSELPMAVWYANVLSGYTTQMVNTISTMTNAAFLMANVGLRNPRTGYFMAKGFLSGIKYGMLEAKEVLREGYNPIRGKIEIPATLELRQFIGGKINPGNYLKYVRRVMVASDVIFYEGLREARAYQLARTLAVSESDAAKNDAALGNEIDPGIKAKDRALALLNATDANLQSFKWDSDIEFSDKMDEIEASNLPPEEKERLVKQAARDKVRRVFELANANRKELVENTKDYDAEGFAARGTYNYKPEGLFGVLARYVNAAATEFPPLRLIVPFTNIIANVANDAANYFPVSAAVRAATGGSITNIPAMFDKTKQKPVVMTDRQKVEMYTKGVIGFSLMTAAYMLSGVWDDDDDEPILEITANGFGSGANNYQKNYNLRDAGWQPYSFRIKMPSGKYSPWISYQYSPLILAFGFIGNLRDAKKYKKQKADPKMWGFAATQTTRALLDMSFLNSINSVLSVAMNPSDDDIVTDGLKGFAATAKTFVVPNLWTQGFKATDKLFDHPTKETKGLLMGQMLKDIPFARDNYQNMVNVLGDPIYSNMDKFIESDSDPLFKLIIDKGMENLKKPNMNTMTMVDPGSIIMSSAMKAKIASGKISKSSAYNLLKNVKPGVKMKFHGQKFIPLETAVTQEEFYTFSINRGSYIKTQLQKMIDTGRTDELDAKWMAKTQEEATDVANVEVMLDRLDKMFK